MVIFREVVNKRKSSFIFVLFWEYVVGTYSENKQTEIILLCSQRTAQNATRYTRQQRKSLSTIIHGHFVTSRELVAGSCVDQARV
jgi:hypothetical protein